MVKNLLANAGDIRDLGSIPGLERYPGGGHGNPLQYSCLEDPMDRGVWWAIVHGVAKSWTRLRRLTTHMATQKSVLSSAAFPLAFGKLGYLCFHNGVSLNAPLLPLASHCCCLVFGARFRVCVCRVSGEAERISLGFPSLPLTQAASACMGLRGNSLVSFLLQQQTAAISYIVQGPEHRAILSVFLLCPQS